MPSPAALVLSQNIDKRPPAPDNRIVGNSAPTARSLPVGKGFNAGTCKMWSYLQQAAALCCVTAPTGKLAQNLQKSSIETRQAEPSSGRHNSSNNHTSRMFRNSSNAHITKFVHKA